MNRSENVKVFCRIRPRLGTELEECDKDFYSLSSNSVEISQTKLPVEYQKNKDEKYAFRYDGVFGPEKTQKDVWEEMGMDTVLDQVLEGYHGTIFAYGQTGSGKTYSMEGLTYGLSDAVRGVVPQFEETPSENYGLIPRIAEQLFSKIKKAASVGAVAMRSDEADDSKNEEVPPSRESSKSVSDMNAMEKVNYMSSIKTVPDNLVQAKEELAKRAKEENESEEKSLEKSEAVDQEVDQEEELNIAGTDYVVKCSFLQIYNEKIYDLLNTTGYEEEEEDFVETVKDGEVVEDLPPEEDASKEDQAKEDLLLKEEQSKARRRSLRNRYKQRANLPSNLRLRNHKGEFYAENLFEFTCTKSSEIMQYFLEGIQSRIIAQTSMNHCSSRSHAIFEIKVESKSTRAKLQLVDLAGSERPFAGQGIHDVQLTENLTTDHLHPGYLHAPVSFASATTTASIQSKKRFQETVQINTSLFILRKVITALASGKSPTQGFHIPFRESKLTCLLQHAIINGNSNTIMLACLSPSAAYFQESLSTLHYASLATKLKTCPVRNLDPNIMMIEKLRFLLQKAHDYIISKEGSLPRELQIDDERLERFLERRHAPSKSTNHAKSFRHKFLNKVAQAAGVYSANDHRSPTGSPMRQRSIDTYEPDSGSYNPGLDGVQVNVNTPNGAMRIQMDSSSRSPTKGAVGGGRALIAPSTSISANKPTGAQPPTQGFSVRRLARWFHNQDDMFYGFKQNRRAKSAERKVPSSSKPNTGVLEDAIQMLHTKKRAEQLHAYAPHGVPQPNSQPQSVGPSPSPRRMKSLDATMSSLNNTMQSLDRGVTFETPAPQAQSIDCSLPFDYNSAVSTLEIAKANAPPFPEFPVLSPHPLEKSELAKKPVVGQSDLQGLIKSVDDWVEYDEKKSKSKQKKSKGSKERTQKHQQEEKEGEQHDEADFLLADLEFDGDVKVIRPAQDDMFGLGEVDDMANYHDNIRNQQQKVGGNFGNESGDINQMQDSTGEMIINGELILNQTSANGKQSFDIDNVNFKAMSDNQMSAFLDNLIGGNNLVKSPDGNINIARHEDVGVAPGGPLLKPVENQNASEEFERLDQYMAGVILTKNDKEISVRSDLGHVDIPGSFPGSCASMTGSDDLRRYMMKREIQGEDYDSSGTPQQQRSNSLFRGPGDHGANPKARDHGLSAAAVIAARGRAGSTGGSTASNIYRKSVNPAVQARNRTRNHQKNVGLFREDESAELSPSSRRHAEWQSEKSKLMQADRQKGNSHMDDMRNAAANHLYRDNNEKLSDNHKLNAHYSGDYRSGDKSNGGKTDRGSKDTHSVDSDIDQAEGSTSVGLSEAARNILAKSREKFEHQQAALQRENERLAKINEKLRKTTLKAESEKASLTQRVQVAETLAAQELSRTSQKGDTVENVKAVLEKWATDKKGEAVALKKEVNNLKKKKHIMMAMMSKAAPLEEGLL